MSDIASYISLTLIAIGLFFVFTAAVGVLKLTDLYTRLHAASKASTFGFCFIVLGAMVMSTDPSDIAKGFLAILFQFISSPIGAHMIARVALKKGVRPVRNPQGAPLEQVDTPPAGVAAES